MSDVAPDEARIAAEIARLKAEFPKTRDLYREVCALLFFRFGITPTANRLYQLVRKGSMSTPTAVLSAFWAELREKSRVRIEHPDLPAELQGAAGELVATLWSRATAAAQESLAALQADAELQQRTAQESVGAVQAELTRTETALEQRTAALLAAQVRIRELEQTAAVVEATRLALEGEVERLQVEGRARDGALAQMRADFSVELEKLRASAELAENRLQAAEKRALLEIERERSANVRLQREADAAARRAAQADEKARAEIQTLQKALGDLRHQTGVLEGRLEALRAANAALTREAGDKRQKGEPARAAGKAARARAATGAAAGGTRRAARQGKGTGPTGSRSGK